MENTQIVSIGLVAAGQQITATVQFDTPFPDTEYATGISLASNEGTAADAGRPKGLNIVSIAKRTDGADVTLANPAAIDQVSDTMQFWAGN